MNGRDPGTPADWISGDCGDECECVECLAAEAEARRNTPGTAEYRERVEAEGQKRLLDLPEWVP